MATPRMATTPNCCLWRREVDDGRGSRASSSSRRRQKNEVLLASFLVSNYNKLWKTVVPNNTSNFNHTLDFSFRETKPKTTNASARIHCAQMVPTTQHSKYSQVSCRSSYPVRAWLCRQLASKRVGPSEIKKHGPGGEQRICTSQ